MREYINVGWCSPYRIVTSTGDTIFVAINENKLAGCRINGKDDNSITLADLARRCNPNYDEYGWSDLHILLDSPSTEALECAECPWRDICDQQLETAENSNSCIPVEYQDGFEWPSEDKLFEKLYSAD